MMTLPLLVLALFPQDDTEVVKALEIFKAAVRTPGEVDRASAVTELAKVPHKKTFAQIAPRLMSDGKTVRIAAAKGLANFTEPDLKKKALPMLARALAVNKKEPMVQAAILETIGTLKDPAVLTAVHREFGNRDAAACTAAFKAAGEIGSAKSVDAILNELRKLEQQAKRQGGGGVNTGGLVGGGGGGYNIPDDAKARQRAQMAMPAALKALQLITNEKFSNYKEWSLFWRANRGKFKK